MATVWYCLVALMIAGYVILDGFDLGAGILHFSVGRTESQRRRVIEHEDGDAQGDRGQALVQLAPAIG